MNCNELMAHYRAIHQAAKQMLAFAHRGDWKRVSETASHIAQAANDIADVNLHQLLTADAEIERAEIIRSLLKIDNEVRHLREPWTQNLNKLLGG